MNAATSIAPHLYAEHEADLYVRATRFAATAHQGARFPGTKLPYLLHVVQVCHEALGATLADPGLDRRLILACALLHDTIEDTPTTEAEIEAAFDPAVARGVAALTKPGKEDGTTLDKERRMADSLQRIRAQPREVWVVKLADRITNLQAPPHYWSRARIRAYQAEARLILEQLGEASSLLAARLQDKIAAYGAYADDPHRKEQ